MRNFRRHAVALAALAGASSLAAQQLVEDAPDPWVHVATGVPFPAQVGEFTRSQVVEYSTDGRDAGVSYRLDRAALTVSIYIYPAFEGWDCLETFVDAKLALESDREVRLLGQERVSPPAGSGPDSAYRSRYAMAAGAMGANIPAVRSDVYLYCPPGDEWLVKYRATWPAEADLEDAPLRLLEAIDWPAALGG